MRCAMNRCNLSPGVCSKRQGIPELGCARCRQEDREPAAPVWGHAAARVRGQEATARHWGSLGAMLALCRGG